MKRFYSNEHENQRQGSYNAKPREIPIEGIKNRLQALEKQIDEREMKYYLHSWNHYKFYQNYQFIDK